MSAQRQWIQAPPLANRSPLPRWSNPTLWTIALGVGLAGAAGVVAGSGDWALAVLVVGAPAFLLIATAAPERTTLALLAVLPFMFYPAAAGRFSLFIAVPLFGFVSLVLLVRERARLHRLRRTLPVLPFALLSAIAIGTAVLSSDPPTAFSRVFYILIFGMFAGALALTVQSGRLTRESIAKAIIYAGALSAIAIIIQFTAQFPLGRLNVIDWLQSVYAFFGGERAARINLTTSNWELASPDVLRGLFPFMTPPSAGQFLMMTFIASIWTLRERKATAGSRLILILTILIGVGLLLTFSRQSWVGALVGLLALGVTRRPGRMFAVVGALVVLISVVPIPGSNQSFGSHLLTASDTSTESTDTRLEVMGDVLDKVPDYALIGVGPGLIGTLENVDVFYAHNVFLDATVELGIAGGLMLVAIFVLGLRSAWRQKSPIAFALLSAFVIASLFDDVLLFPRNGLILAAAFALIATGSRERVSAPANAGTEAWLRSRGSNWKASPSTRQPTHAGIGVGRPGRFAEGSSDPRRTD